MGVWCTSFWAMVSELTGHTVPELPGIQCLSCRAYSAWVARRTVRPSWGYTESESSCGHTVPELPGVRCARVESIRSPSQAAGIRCWVAGHIYTVFEPSCGYMMLELPGIKCPSYQAYGGRVAGRTVPELPGVQWPSVTVRVLTQKFLYFNINFCEEITARKNFYSFIQLLKMRK